MTAEAFAPSFGLLGITALLGYHTGDEFEWEMPVGLLRYRVEQVISQPEASGDYDRSVAMSGWGAVAIHSPRGTASYSVVVAPPTMSS